MDSLPGTGRDPEPVHQPVWAAGATWQRGPWFSGNIGFHHIHHLSPRIPNYELERAHKSEPLFQTVKPLTVRTSLKSLIFRLWDEGRRKLIGYKPLKGLRRQASQKPDDRTPS